MRWFVAAVLLVSITCPSFAELLPVRDVLKTPSGDCIFFAYEDCQVWVGCLSPLTQLASVDRPVPIKKLVATWPSGGFYILYILYDDDQVWTATSSYSGFLLDASREGAAVTSASIREDFPYVFTYSDGQVWYWQFSQWQRAPYWERDNPASPVIEQTATEKAPRFSATPNPGHSGFTLAAGTDASIGTDISVADASGRIVATLHTRSDSAGQVLALWNALDDSGREVPSGVYFAKITTPDGEQTVKLVLTR